MGQAPVAFATGGGSLDNPSIGQNGQAMGVRALEDLDFPTTGLGGRGYHS